MEKRLLFQNVIFKFVSADKDKYQTNYHFIIYDLNSIEALTETKTKLDQEKTRESNYEFNHAFWIGRKDRIHFKVKDKWLERKEYEPKQYYQGNLELVYYSMEKKDHFAKRVPVCPSYYSRRVFC